MSTNRQTVSIRETLDKNGTLISVLRLQTGELRMGQGLFIHFQPSRVVLCIRQNLLACIWRVLKSLRNHEPMGGPPRGGGGRTKKGGKKMWVTAPGNRTPVYIHSLLFYLQWKTESKVTKPHMTWTIQCKLSTHRHEASVRGFYLRKKKVLSTPDCKRATSSH